MRLAALRKMPASDALVLAAIREQTSGRWTAVSLQPSAFSLQPSAISYQPSAVIF
jgi:hypothetical protein